MTTLDTGDAAIGALNLSCRILEKMAAKGLITDLEAREIVQSAIDLADTPHQAALQQAMRNIFGNLGL